MTAAARSIQIFGIYLALMSVGLTAMPALTLAPFGLEAPQEIWVRVLGLAAGVLAIYYFACAKANARAFFVATTVSRPLFFMACIALVFTVDAPWQLVLFGAVDLAGAVWTRLALNRDPA